MSKPRIRIDESSPVFVIIQRILTSRRGGRLLRRAARVLLHGITHGRKTGGSVVPGRSAKILAVWEECSRNAREAARRLGVDERTIYRHVTKIIGPGRKGGNGYTDAARKARRAS